MLTEVGHLIRDNVDKMNLFAMKTLGTILLFLAVFGYLESVSKFDHLLSIHISIAALILLLVSILGYSVYTYKMMTDIAGDATLLNHLFMVFAFTNQIRNPLLFSLVIVEALSLKQTDYYCVAINCTHFVKLFLTWTTFSIALVTLLKNKRPQS